MSSNAANLRLSSEHLRDVFDALIERGLERTQACRGETGQRAGRRPPDDRLSPNS